MNRIDRLFGILLLLQARKRVRSSDLAQAFEISERTVYRDIAALSEMGVPIYTVWGEGYELLEDFYLPPLLFTHIEARVLVLGIRMLGLQAVGSTLAGADQALFKIWAVLPGALRQQVEAETEIIHFIVPSQRFDLDDPRLSHIQRAIIDRRVCHIGYHTYWRNTVTQRDIEPLTLTYSEGAWYVRAYCRLREGMRAFRLSRIDSLDVLEETFTARGLETEPDQAIPIRVRFAAHVVRWVRERQHYAFHAELETSPSGDVTFEYRPDTLSEMKSWLLGWGTDAELLAPQTLREELREEAIRLAEILT